MTENVAVVLVDLLCCKLREFNNEYECLNLDNFDFFSMLTGESQASKEKKSPEIKEKRAALRRRAKKYFEAVKDIEKEYPGDEDAKERREVFEKLTPSLLDIYDEVFKDEKDV